MKKAPSFPELPVERGGTQGKGTRYAEGPDRIDFPVIPTGVVVPIMISSEDGRCRFPAIRAEDQVSQQQTPARAQAERLAAGGFASGWYASQANGRFGSSVA